MNDYPILKEYNHQGLILYSQNKYDAALAYFKKAMDIDSKYIDSYINTAQVLIMQDDYDEAVKYLNKAILIDKKCADVYFHLGNIALLQSNTEAARDYYNKAISLGYNNVQIFINLASDAEERTDIESALSYYNRAIALDKYNAFSKARKTQLLLRMKRFTEALKSCDSLIETNPDVFEGYHYKFAILTELQRFEEAEDVVNRGIQLFPDDEAFLYDKARLLQAKKQPEEALKLIDDKLKITENNRTGLISFRCELLLALGRIDEAETLLIEEYEASHNEEIAYLLNSVSLSKQNYLRVLDCSKYIIDHGEINNYYYAALYYHAVALTHLGKEKEASDAYNHCLRFFRAACAKTPGQLQLYFYRAMCHQQLKQYDKALEMTDFLLNVDGNLTEANMIRYKIFSALGKEKEAAAEKSIIQQKKPELLRVMGE